MHSGFVCNWINSTMFMQFNILTAKFSASIMRKRKLAAAANRAANLLTIFTHIRLTVNTDGKFLMVSFNFVRSLRFQSLSISYILCRNCEICFGQLGRLFLIGWKTTAEANNFIRDLQIMIKTPQKKVKSSQRSIRLPQTAKTKANL